MTRATSYALALVFMFVAYPAFSQCDTYDAYVEVGTSSSEYYSSATARCYWQGVYGYAFLSVEHSIKAGQFGTGSTLYFFSHQNTGYEASNSTNWFGNPDECFYTEGYFFISGETYHPVYYDGTASACACIPPAPADDSDGGTDEEDYGQDSPIVVDFGPHPYRFTSPEIGVLFDIDADGAIERVAWPQNPAQTAFLVIDSNGNGVIDDGTELFGNATPLGSGRAPHGFAALAALDENADGLLDESDSRWRHLLLWFDTRRDGVAQADELRPISSAIERLSLAYRTSQHRDRHGNRFRYMALAVVANDERTIPYYDVFLLHK